MAKSTKRKSNLRICDDLWSKLIKVKAWFKCEYCWKTTHLNSHHIFSRTNYSTRYDIDNGICLCSYHHTLCSSFSAHKTPADFVEWLKELRGEEWYNNLRFKAKQKRDKDYEKVERYLIDETKKLTD
jgi:predicted restriction endonuclease